MNLTIDLTPQTEAWLNAEAQQRGLRPVDFARSVLEEHASVVVDPPAPPRISAKNAAALAYLRKRIADEATDDPEEIRKADAEVEELIQNLNRNRIESGESPLFS
ncbi:MAG: hypothetical protein ACLQVD_07185 [Capsulimonadaceae bacterium]